MLAALQPGQRAERAARHPDVDREQQPRGPQRVAAEESQVPGGARAREDVAGVIGLGEQQRVEVVEGVREQRGQARIVGPDGVGALQPHRGGDDDGAGVVHRQ